MTARMDKRFADLAAEGRPALVTYFMAGDPDFDTSLAIMKALPSAGGVGSNLAKGHKRH